MERKIQGRTGSGGCSGSVGRGDGRRNGAVARRSRRCFHAGSGEERKVRRAAYTGPKCYQAFQYSVDCLLPRLTTLGQMKCFAVIVRYTAGWSEYSARISLSDFEVITGLSRNTVIKALRDLEGGLGLIRSERRKDRKGDQAATEYWVSFPEGMLPSAGATGAARAGSGIPIVDEGSSPGGSSSVAVTETDDCRGQLRRETAGTWSARTRGDGGLREEGEVAGDTGVDGVVGPAFEPRVDPMRGGNAEPLTLEGRKEEGRRQVDIDDDSDTGVMDGELSSSSNDSISWIRKAIRELGILEKFGGRVTDARVSCQLPGSGGCIATRD